MDFRGNEAQTCLSSEGNFSRKRANDMDFARLVIIGFHNRRLDW
jgi:hypothetical protein